MVCAVENAGNQSNSVLPAIARHERELLERKQQAAEEARRIAETAHREAADLLEREAARLAEEIAAIRREAEAERERERQERERESLRKLEALRAEARGQSGAAVQAVLNLVLPRSKSVR
jgi:hypothetical protein